MRILLEAFSGYRTNHLKPAKGNGDCSCESADMPIFMPSTVLYNWAEKILTARVD